MSLHDDPDPGVARDGDAGFRGRFGGTVGAAGGEGQAGEEVRVQRLDWSWGPLLHHWQLLDANQQVVAENYLRNWWYDEWVRLHTFLPATGT